MYWTPCARLMKSITPNTSVRPAAIRNSSTPSCRPLRVWTMSRERDITGALPLAPRSVERVPSKRQRARRVRGSCDRASRCPSPGSRSLVTLSPQKPGEGLREDRTSLHRAVLDVWIGVVGEYLLGDLGLEFAVGALGDLHQIEILDRVVVGVELELAAQRGEIRLHERSAQRVLVVGFATGHLKRRVDQQCGVIGLRRVAARHGVVFLLVRRHEGLVLRVVEIRRPIGAAEHAERRILLRRKGRL